MIGLELSMSSDAARRAELKQTLQNLSREAVSEGVSRECRVFEDLSGPNDFLWLQWYPSQRELETFLGSAGFATLLGAIKVLGSLKSLRTVELLDSTSVLNAVLTDRVEGADHLNNV